MRTWVIGIVLAGALLAACSADAEGADAAAGDEGGSAAGTIETIAMRDDAFVPSEATIDAGDVQLVNEGESAHNFSVEGEGIDVDVDPGTTTTRPIDLAAGTYTMFCEFHRSNGMEGTLTVVG